MSTNANGDIVLTEEILPTLVLDNISTSDYIKASNTENGDFFGWEIAISDDGNTLAVDAYQEDGNAFRSGAVYIFTRNGNTWSQQAYVKSSNTERRDSFGSSIDLSNNGNTLVVGANEEDSSSTGLDSDQLDNTEIDSGAVYVFTINGRIWSQ